MSSSEQTAHVGPIIFGNRTARGQLLNHGEVVTFRATERTTGDTWWRKTRTGEKEGDVVVKQIRKCDPSDVSELEELADKSGFAGAEEWQQAIEDVHGDLGTGYLYYVHAELGDCGKCGEENPLPTGEFCPTCAREEAADMHYSKEAKGHAQ